MIVTQVRAGKRIASTPPKTTQLSVLPQIQIFAQPLSSSSSKKDTNVIALARMEAGIAGIAVNDPPPAQPSQQQPSQPSPPPGGPPPQENSHQPQVDFVYDVGFAAAAEAASAATKAAIKPPPRTAAKPKSMSRAKAWSIEVENSWRFQSAGFRDGQEYAEHYPEDPAPTWPGGPGFIKVLQHKETGFFMYFRQTRECEDKYLPKIKMYTY